MGKGEVAGDEDPRSIAILFCAGQAGPLPHESNCVYFDCGHFNDVYFL